jgi:hypothetical protein
MACDTKREHGQGGGPPGQRCGSGSERSWLFQSGDCPRALTEWRDDHDTMLQLNPQQGAPDLWLRENGKHPFDER